MWLPKGTVILSEECGFVLPDGRYLRLYAHGVQEELPGGRPIGFADDEPRPQWNAWRIRVGRGAFSAGTLDAEQYVTGFDVELVLPDPDTLAGMNDRALIVLSRTIVRRIVELGVALELSGYRPRRRIDGRSGVVHVIDLMREDQLGAIPVG